MSADRFLILAVGIVLELTLLLGLVVRKRYSSCLSFPLYVIAVLIPSVLFAAWPARFYTWENYVLKEMVHNLLKFAIALELAYRTFRVFPGARSTARAVLLCTVIGMGLVVLSATPPERDPSFINAEWHARVLNGTIWLMTAIAAVILWYRLPIEPFHKAILVGFVPYLLVFSFGVKALADVGHEGSALLQYAPILVYTGLLGYWNQVAWSRATEAVPAMRAASAALKPTS